MDIGSLNIGTAAASGGELQLTHTGGYSISSVQTLGIRGDINNLNGTLVVGRRVPTGINTFGNSLNNPGTEVIRGITINETGNFTQAAAGTLAVGINPTLIRQSSSGTFGGTGGTELLAPAGCHHDRASSRRLRLLAAPALRRKARRRGSMSPARLRWLARSRSMSAGMRSIRLRTDTRCSPSPTRPPSLRQQLSPAT